MKSVKPLVAVAVAAAAVVSWASVGHSATSARWTSPSDLNVDGVRLGMARADARKVAHVASYGSMMDIKYDQDGHVDFVSGFHLSEGNRAVATCNESYQVSLKTLGIPLAKGDDRVTESLYYRAGTSFVIFRYDAPSLDRRTASMSQFALARDVASIPSGWSREVLQKTLGQ